MSLGRTQSGHTTFYPLPGRMNLSFGNEHLKETLAPTLIVYQGSALLAKVAAGR